MCSIVLCYSSFWLECLSNPRIRVLAWLIDCFGILWGILGVKGHLTPLSEGSGGEIPEIPRRFFFFMNTKLEIRLKPWKISVKTLRNNERRIFSGVYPRAVHNSKYNSSLRVDSLRSPRKFRVIKCWRNDFWGQNRG